MLKPENINYNGYLISNDKKLLQTDKICELLSKSYWAKDRPKDKIEASIENSVCFGVYLNNKQVGFARVVTDYAVIYWLCDVIIDEHHRKKGLGKKLIEAIINNSELKNLAGILATMDAHGLYEQYGFVKDAERFMRKKPQ
jgi:predicted GNAT family N-acyltransferase